MSTLRPKSCLAEEPENGRGKIGRISRVRPSSCNLVRIILANDSVTIAVEIPIWLAANDIDALEIEHGIRLLPEGHEPRVLTGHIDFLQVRNGAVHILDYKPDARTNRPIAQLTLYALALTRLAGLRLFDIKCAWFNEEQYCEFFPRSLIARQP